MTDRQTGRWTPLLIRLCLLTWPRRLRRRDGDAALRTILDEWCATPARGRRALLVLSECAEVCGAGLQMRRRALGGVWRELALGWGSDLRLALRGLRRSPGFTLSATLTLAIGIGGNAAVFGLVDQIFRGPSPYSAPERLLLVWNTLGDAPARMGVAAPDAAVLRERSRSLAEVAFMFGVVDAALEDDAGGAAQHVRVATVSDGFFPLLGATPVLGRTLGPGDGPVGEGEPEGRQPTAGVLSHAFWRSSFAADRGVVGRTIRLSGRPVRVVGVLAPDFTVELPPDAGIAVDGDLWVPLDVPLSEVRRSDGRRRDQDSNNTGVTISRVREGVSVPAAVAEVADVGMQLQAELPDYAAADLRLGARPMRQDATVHASGLARVLLAGGVILLLAASLNISALVLARGLARRREFAVRRAIGAGRARLVRALVTESGVVLALGTGLATVVASLVSRILVTAMPPAFVSVPAPVWNGRVLGVAAALAGLFILAATAAPMLTRARGRDTPGGIAVGRHSHPPRRRAVTSGRRVLVLSQVALSVLLVLGSAYLTSSARELSRTRPGFEPAGVLTFSLSLRTPGRYSSPGARAGFMREVELAVESIAGVTAAGLVGELPLAGGRWTQPYGWGGQAEHEWEANRADFRVVTSRYFDAMGVRLLEGRVFTPEEDLVEDRRVVIVDAKLAQRISTDGTAVGAQIGFPLDGAAVTAEIVGVVEHVRHDELERDGREALYVPYRQEASRDVSFVVRSGRSPEVLAPAVRAKVFEIDPQVPLYDVSTMTTYVDAQIAPTRFALVLLGAFGLLTLLASAIGLYGVVALDVAKRTRDIGLRMALGESGNRVLRGFLLGGLHLGIMGLATGSALAVAFMALLGSWFPTVRLGDPVPWITTAAVVLSIAAIASWIPARRASRLDPTAALKVEE